MSGGKKVMGPTGHSLSYKIVAKNNVVKIVVLEKEQSCNGAWGYPYGAPMCSYLIKMFWACNIILTTDHQIEHKKTK